ncbi:MAG: C25 family cysteine peptidase [Candidatus Cloacimonetes bacterium]|nr:C25 family cysteine peptidase [Candidatus Cloacimonadota bacterium]
MKVKCIVLIVLVCVVSILAAVSESPLKVLYQDSKHIKLQLTTPAIDVQSMENSRFKYITMDRSQPMAETGYPELPMYSAMIAIPSQGDFTISVQEGNYYTKSGIVPKPVYATDEEELSQSLNQAAYASKSLYPQKTFTHSSAQILRDFRVIQLSLYPVQYNGSNQELKIAREITVNITMNEQPGENELPAYSGYSAAFKKIYESQISNFSFYRDPLLAPAFPRILLIHGNSTEQTFLNKVNEFAIWKRQKGYEVNVASTALIGSTSNTGIKNYIQTQYNDLSTRPDFIILLGDTNGSYPIPAWTENMSSYSGAGDYPYTHLAGSDLLGDVFIGRISASNMSELDVIINKGYAVEKNVNTVGQGAAWLNRMLLVGDPASGSGISTQYVNKFVKELAIEHNPNYTFLEQYSSGFSSFMNSGINQGVGFFNYRGWIGMSNWSPSSSLINGVKLSHATIFTCSTGNYSGGTSTTEALVRLGTSAVPSGSVTAIGMATSGTHTLFNNCLNAGIYDGIFTHNMRSMGEAMLNAKLYIKEVYGSTHDNQANYFAHWCNLIGDPTVEVFTTIPKALTIIAPESLPLGTNVLDLQVIDDMGVPAGNVCVTAYSNSMDAVIAKGYTNSDGNLTLNLSGGLQNQVILTASAHDCKPVQQTLSVDSGGSLVYFSKQIIDNGTMGSIGNGDSFANAGETIAVNLEIKNTTSSVVSNITALVSCNDPYISMISNQIEFSILNAGQTLFCETPFVFSIGNNIPPEHDVRFSVELSDNARVSYSLIFHVVTYNARLLVHNYEIIAGGNAILDPGESGALQVWIKNNSVSAIYDLNMELSSLNDLLVVTDSTSYLGAISANMMGLSTDGFEVFARSQLIPGMQMPMRIRLFNYAGFEQVVDFNISIGQVHSYTPLGPDAYGYLIYDITDTAFDDCPSYEWIEISPTSGGAGTALTGLNDVGASDDEGDQNGAVTLKVLSLPFPFTFYGETYNQITVCVNGFIALGVTENGEFRNYHLPGGYGPAPMIAAFWDDLVLIQDAGIYQYYDSAAHRYIIQYNKMRNGYNRSSLETFEVIFYDPLYYPTSMGDGMIKIQYKDFNNVDIGNSGYTPWHGNYATVGIKDHTNTRGLEYTYNNIYPHAAAPLGNNKALLITTVPVLHESACLTFQELIINDTNQNEIVEPGETIELGIELKNIGLNSASNIQLSASLNSSYATFTNSTCDYNNIAGEETGVNRNPLVLYISEDCPNETQISIVLNVTADNNSWQFTAYLTVHKPSINVSGIFINDALGNNNSLIEPGETFDFIVNLANNSSLEAKNIISSLSCSSSYVTIANPTVVLLGVPSQSTFQAVYHISLSASAPNGSNLMFSLTYLGDMIAQQTMPISFGVGASGFSEDFESDNGSFVASPTTNGWQWGVSSQGAYSGTQVWGTLLNSQYSANANYTLTTPSVFIGTDVSLEFWHKYNTETNWDGGQVKISTNNGSSWTRINPVGGYPVSNVSALSGPGYAGNSGAWVQASFNLSAYSNQNVLFQFVFRSDTGVQSDGWFIDDVHTTGSIEYAGKVMGAISSSNASLNMSKVLIQNAQQWGVRPDDGGIYTLFLPLGTHQLSASSPGYNTCSASFVITNIPNVSIQDFYLGYFTPATGLNYTVNAGSITLNWNTPDSPEYQLTGYSVYRKIDAGRFELISTVLVPSYTEQLDIYGTYTYHVTSDYLFGSSTATNDVTYQNTSSSEDENINTPFATHLMNNYPNPFNPETTFRFALKESSPTKLNIYNLKGQLVKTLINKDMLAGTHQIVWDGRDTANRNVATGVYLYRLESKNFSQTKRAILMK